MTEPTTPEDGQITVAADNYEALRLYPSSGGGDPILTMTVEGGQLVAHYQPADLDGAAQILVDELVRRFRSHLDASRQVDVDQVRGVLEEAVAGVEPADWQAATVIPVPVAAEAVADLLAVRRADA